MVLFFVRRFLRVNYLGIANELANQTHPSEDYMLVFIYW